MKTTIDLPDDLLIAAKKLAAWRPRVTEQRSAKSTLIKPV